MFSGQPGVRTCERCERSWYSVRHLDEEEATCPECGGRLLPAEDDDGDDGPPSAA
jgi:PHP family Zn ribbon phosphoesterase